MEAASDTAPIESPKRASMGSIIDSAENISTDLSSEEKGPDSTRAVGYTMGSAKVNVADITVVGSQEDCCPAEAYPGHDQREKKLISVVIGCGSREEVDLNVRGLVSEHASKEPDPETGHQWEKEQKMEIGSAQADEVGVLGHRSNGVLAVYYVHKFPVIQLLEACDQDIQPGLFLCMEDTMETVTWNDSLSGNSNSTLMDEGQFDAKFNFSKYFNQLQKDQELEEIPGEILDFCSDQGGVLVQKAIRRQRKNRRGSTVSTTRIVIPRLPSEEIRIIVYRSFQEILMHRLRETDDLNISEDAVLAVASDIEKELFVLFYCTNTRYKNKYRSLMFNLKDPRNTHLFRQVLLGEITPQCLVLMSPTELASLELMEWRKRENKHSIKLITAESDEFERQPMSKLTHKGEIEIERDTDQNLTLEDLMGSSSKSFGDAELSESEISSEVDTTHQHRSHLLDPNCQICMGNRSSNSQKRSLCLHVPLTDYDIGSLADPADSPRGLQWISEKDSLSSAPLVPAVKSGLRRSKESCMTSHLSNWAPDISANEIILFQSKHFSPMENTTGSPSPTKRPAASRRHHLFLVEKQIDSFCKERRIHIARFTLQRFHPQTQSVWKGFIQVSNMKRFLVKAYPVLGHTDLLTKVLSTTITVGRCVLPEAIWDSVDRLRSSGTKEICVVRFKPATRGDTCPYALYYSYLNSRQKYSAVILEQRSTKNVYLIPLPALQKVPSRLPPLSGPGLESFHPDLLLALAFTKKQHSTSAFKKPHECRRGPDRCLQENKSRQKCIEDIDKEHLPGQSQLSPFLAKPGVQPCVLSMLPTKPFTQARELLHHSCQVKPSDLLLGDLLSSEELSSHTDLSNNFADEILKSFYCEEQQSDRIGNMFGSSAFTGEWENDGQNEDLAANEQHHGDGTGKENESRAGSERLNIETNLLTQFKPADVLPENFLLSVTELNSVLQQADESQKEGATPTNEQEADWTASTEYTEDMETYIKELDKLFTNVPLSSFSQHEDCSHLRSTISCCADVLNHLLSASENNLPCETQIPMCSQGSPNSITSSQEGPRHTTQTDSPLPLLTVQMSNNFQHLGPSGTMNFEPGVLLHALPANEVTVHPVEVPFQNVTQPLFPFRFSPSHCQRGIDAESHELPECLLSPYCPTQHHHCTNVHKDIRQGPTTSSGAPSSSSDGVL